MRLVQLQAPDGTTRVAIVEENLLRLLGGPASIYGLALSALTSGVRLTDAVTDCASQGTLAYDPIYRLESDWRLLPPPIVASSQTPARSAAASYRTYLQEISFD